MVANYTGTRADVVRLRKTYPDYTLQRIGETVGVSRERVRQILKAEGLSTKAFRVSKYPPKVCKYCYKFTENQRSYCNTECRTKAHWVKYNCHYCGDEHSMWKAYWKRQSKKYKNHYCSTSCASKSYWKNRKFEQSN